MNSEKSMKKRVFELLEIGNVNDKMSRRFDIFIVAVILINIFVMFLETFDELSEYQHIFRWVEIVTVAIFCVEYVLRIWTSDYLYPNDNKATSAWKFIKSYEGIIELLTILPFFFLSGFVVFRMLRVVRILHLFRINQHTDSLSVIKTVLYEKRNQILSSVFIIFVLMLAASLFMYSAEHDAQPDVFKNAFSCIWYSVSTIFTIGYGDMSPVTVLGRIMGTFIAFLGVGVVAIPTGIISAGFVEQYTQAQNSRNFIDDVNLEIVDVGIDSRWVDLSAEDVDRYHGVAIVMAKRQDITIIPNKDYRVALGDRLIVYREPYDSGSNDTLSDAERTWGYME